MARRPWRASRRPGARGAGVIALTFVVLVTANLVVGRPRRAAEEQAPAVVVPRPEPAPPVIDIPVPPVALGLPAQGPWDPARWRRTSAQVIDRTTLAAEGVGLPEGANVFAARVVDGGPSPAYMLYEAGGGAFDDAFFPASSIKVLAAVGALELAYSAGFTGDAVVDDEYTLWDYYDSAIRYSSNEDYDELVRIAGVDWLNAEFLPERGYSSTRIQEAYADDDEVTESPPVHLEERGRELVLPERSTDDDYGCEAANCSNLFELVDSVRRIVLAGELPADERFEVAPADLSGLQAALRGAESWIAPGVAEALGPDAEVYSKPGWTSGLDCVDIAVVDDSAGGKYLIGVSAPDDGECAVLSTMAADVLTVIARHDDGEAVRTDGSIVPVVDGRQQASRP